MSFIVNILVTLLHKGHIDIHFEVSTLIALGLVTFPWHTLHQFSRLQLNSGVVQDAKTSRATAVGTFNCCDFQFRWRLARCSSTERQTSLNLTDQRKISRKRCWSCFFEAFGHCVVAQRQI